MRHFVRIAAALAFCALVVPAVAQTAPPEPPKDLPRAQRGDRGKNLEALFAALKVAPDDAAAKAVEGRIWAIWLVSGSDTTNVLMARVRQAMEANQPDIALR